MWFLEISALASIYFAAGRLGLYLQSVSGFATFIWAPTGIAIAWLALRGRRLWPGVALGAWLVNFSVHAPAWGALLIAAGNTFEALAAVAILGPGFRPDLRSLKDVQRYGFAAVPAGAAISATIGAAVVSMMGRSAGSHWTDWVTWWIGDVLGALAVGPMILTWAGHFLKTHQLRYGTRKRSRVEVAAYVALLAVATLGVFLTRSTSGNPVHTLTFVSFPFIIWAAIRFTGRANTLTVFFISTVAIFSTVAGRGPFAIGPIEESLFYLDTFMAVASLSGLLLNAALCELLEGASIAAAHEVLQRYVNHMVSLNAMLDLDGQVRAISSESAALIGSRVEDLVGRSFLDGAWWAHDPETLARVRAAFESALRGKAVRYEETAKGKDGLVPLCLFFTPVPGRDGAPEFIIAEAFDLTPQMEAQKMLQARERELIEAQRIAHVGSWQWDIARDQVRWSDELYRIFDVRKSEVGEFGFEDAIARCHPEDRAHARSAISQAIENVGPFRVEARIVRPTGEVRVLQNVGEAFPGEDGKAALIVGTCRDITELKRAEQERDELLHRERSARQEAESANRAKDEFLAMLSHELRTPLTSILSWSQVLRGGKRDEPSLAKGLEVIELAATAQGALINDLLDISRIAMGKFTMNFSPIDFARTVRDAVDALRPQAQSGQVLLKLTPASGEIAVMGDSVRLKQVVWNLVNNAIHFTPAGGTVEVVCEAVPGERGKARLSVTDTGVGMSRDFIGKAFDVFTQEDGGSTRRHGGLGLGLGIVKRLVELHGGTVCAESRGVGLGARFIVELPALESTRGLASPETRRSSRLREADAMSPALTSYPLRQARVVLVDDERMTCEAVAEVLRRAGAKVTTAFSVEEGVEAIRRERPDILVSDIAMPDEDGFDFLRRVRGELRLGQAELPAIALTAYAGAEDVERARSHGFEGHLAKPFNVTDLVQLVAEVLARRPRKGHASVLHENGV